MVENMGYFICACFLTGIVIGNLFEILRTLLSIKNILSNIYEKIKNKEN